MEDIGSGASAGFAVLMTLVQLAVAIVAIVAMWKVYVKANKPGWAAIIPFYNLWVMLEIVGRPG